MNFVSWFGQSKRIYGICPCCVDVFRLSDAMLFTAEPSPRTSFDRLLDFESRIEAAEERFEDAEERMREEALERGHREAARRLRRIAPYFKSNRIDPMDVKVLFHPVEYVAFRGVADGGPTQVRFVDKAPLDRRQEQLHSSLDHQLKRHVGRELQIARDAARERIFTQELSAPLACHSESGLSGRDAEPGSLAHLLRGCV